MKVGWQSGHYIRHVSGTGRSVPKGESGIVMHASRRLTLSLRCMDRKCHQVAAKPPSSNSLDRSMPPGLGQCPEPIAGTCDNGRGTIISRAWVLIGAQEPPLGSHIGTPRRGYLHHGIYVGGGHVVHYAGYVHGLRPRPVEEVQICRFTDGRPLLLKRDQTTMFEHSEVIQRARSRIGESRYRLLTNNCEHFCEWCLNGEQRSYQVEALGGFWRNVTSTVVQGLARCISRVARMPSDRPLCQ